MVAKSNRYEGAVGWVGASEGLIVRELGGRAGSKLPTDKSLGGSPLLLAAVAGKILPLEAGRAKGSECIKWSFEYGS